jgi:hypothetical protein
MVLDHTDLAGDIVVLVLSLGTDRAGLLGVGNPAGCSRTAPVVVDRVEIPQRQADHTTIGSGHMMPDSGHSTVVVQVAHSPVVLGYRTIVASSLVLERNLAVAAPGIRRSRELVSRSPAARTGLVEDVDRMGLTLRYDVVRLGRGYVGYEMQAAYISRVCSKLSVDIWREVTSNC